MTGVLHTNSAYFSSTNWMSEKAEHFNIMNIMNSFNDAYNYAREQELNFYHSFFDVNTYEAFIQALRDLFREARGDGERIRSLANANLSTFIPKQSMKAQINYQLTITGDLCKQIPIELLASNNISVDGGPIYLNLNTNSVKTIKNIVNQELGRRFDNENSYNMRNLKQWFNQITAEKATEKLTENITITKTSVANKDIIISDKIEGFLFANNLDKKQKEAYLKGEYGAGLQKQFEDEMKQALNKIKNFIFNDCLQVNNGMVYEGVNILKEAAKNTWNDVIGDDILFFFEGDNLYKSVLGKIGEFQIALLDRYIHMILPLGNVQLGNIIGGIVDGNRQEPRSDYQLVLELGGDIGNTILGIQSKNIGDNSMQKVKINSDLGLVAPNLSVGFTDAIVNSYFNTDILVDIGNMTAYLKQYLDTYFWKAMNLNIGENLNPNHTNTFYWTGGSALVPASRIIETLNRELITSPEFDITKAAWKDLSNEEFLQEAEDGDPIFTEYWHGSFDHWTALDNNAKVYQQLLDNTRIHTEFSMARIFNANGGMAAFEFLRG